ncbi:MAG: hypothetical protein J6S85_13485 [Methanobrevibacter sp.]|nr:hypothetical protein [Methanobrevibacter sp.]
MARCFVVSLIRGGIKFYFKREDEPKGAGVFSPDLLEAQKFLKEYEAKFFAERFTGAQVEIIKTGEVLK